MAIGLMTQPTIWETPRTIVIIVGTAVALSSAVSGWVGYKIGSAPPLLIVIQLQQPVTPPRR